MEINNFYKTHLIYQTEEFISDIKKSLLRELVAYTNDPVRYKRRFRMLINLIDYEQQIIEKIRDFQTDNENDLNILFKIKEEVLAITNRDA